MNSFIRTNIKTIPIHNCFLTTLIDGHVVIRLADSCLSCYNIAARGQSSWDWGCIDFCCDGKKDTHKNKKFLHTAPGEKPNFVCFMIYL